MKKLLFLSLLFTSQFSTQFIHANSLPVLEQSSLCKAIRNEIKSGDLIFTAVDSFIFKQVAKDTQTWTSHVGITFFDDGEWYVYESKIPVSVATPLCNFIDRSLNEQVEVRRFQLRLNKNILKDMKSSAEERLGYYYDTGFNYDNETRMYCSKFVYQIYEDVDIQVGKIESMKDLLESNLNADVDFWKTWYLGRIPWERRIITPASLLHDPKFATIFSNNVKTANSQHQQ